MVKRTIGNKIRIFFLKIWRRTPIDGSGIVRFGPRSSRRFGRLLAKSRWKKVPIWAMPAALVCARLWLLVAAPTQVFLWMRSNRALVSWSVAFRALWLTLTRGKSPKSFLTAYPSIGTDNKAPVRLKMLEEGLDDLQGALLLSAIGNRKDIELASDKVLATRALSNIGIPVAPILAELNARSTQLNLLSSPWVDNDKLFIKPRSGFAAQGAMSVQRTADGHFKIGNSILNPKQFSFELMSYFTKTPIIIQPFLRPGPTTWDISQETATWLRIFVYRTPGESAKLLSTSLKILPPGKDVESNIGNILMAPICPIEGTVCDAVLPNRPSERFSDVPWNGAKLRGRVVPEWQQATQMALRGSDLFPGLPIIGWDVLLSDQGPLILEPNTGVSWAKAQLWYYETATPSPLTPAILKWVEKLEQPLP